MKMKLLLAAAISALSLGATGAQAAPVPALNDIATQGDAAVEQATFKFYYYGYYGYPYYYYYKPYYPYYYYPYCPYWKKLKGWC
jgi:hypothetical protein